MPNLQVLQQMGTGLYELSLSSIYVARNTMKACHLSPQAH